MVANLSYAYIINNKKNIKKCKNWRLMAAHKSMGINQLPHSIIYKIIS